MSRPKYKEITCKSILHKLKSSFLPYRWDVNVYRGCEHACPYCFARYSHQYLGYDNPNDFDNVILAKVNAPQVFGVQLGKSSWNGELVNLGGVCDSYQPAENHFKITREMWKILIKYKNPAVMSTKSDLIIRDVDLIKQLSKNAFVGIAVSIITLDDNLRKILEPNVSSVEARLSIFEAFKNSNVKLRLHFMPILPFITDNYVEFERIIKLISDCKLDGFAFDFLNLRSSTRNRFFHFLSKNFNHLLTDYLSLYGNKKELAEYKNNKYVVLKELMNKYDIKQKFDFKKAIENSNRCFDRQLTLFDV